MIQFPDPRIRKENGTYFLYERGEIRWGSDYVGIYFSIGEMWTLHRIGPEKEVFEHYTEAIRKYREKNFFDMADQLRFVTSNQWDCEDLNRIIHITGSIKSVLKQRGFMP